MASHALLGVLAFASLALAGANARQGEAVSPAITQVITMLDNIDSMIETETQTDGQEHQEFLKWSAQERAEVATHIGELQTEIQTTTAVLADLRSQKTELETTLARITSELTEETSQLNQATERRQEENSAFVTEQQNFENAINACSQAVKLLAAHYGNGEEHAAVKPQFLSLINKYIKTVHDAARMSKGSRTLALVQRAGSPRFDTYQDSSSEAGSIVDEVRELSETFAEDKQSAAEAEAGLQRAYDTLREQKQALIATLTQERDSQQSQLNTVNQNIAESEGSLQMAQELLADRQSYAANCEAQLNAATVAFNTRQKDRDAELEAVRTARGVLEQVSLLQAHSSHHTVRGGVQAVDSAAAAHLTALRGELANFGKGKAWAARIQARASMHTGTVAKRLLRGGTRCHNCPKAAALLRQKASTLHSATLSAAAATALGNEQLRDVVGKLEALIANLDAEQQSEQEHKSWCETEQRRTSMRRDGHEHAVGEIQQTINGLIELVDMKKTDFSLNRGEDNDEDNTFVQQQEVRNTDHHEYEEDVQDAMDAIAALNEAIKILADFYASRSQALVQTGSLAKAGLHTNPESGSSVVEMMSETRHEFEHAEADLKTTEAEAVTQFAAIRAEHVATDNTIDHTADVITVEKQTADQALESNRQDLTSNEAEIAAAKSYLQRLGQSCDPLIENFEQRTHLRTEEKTAIQDAIRILQEVA